MSKKKEAEHTWKPFWQWLACSKCGQLKNTDGKPDEPCEKPHSHVDLSQTWSKPEPVHPDCYS